MGDEVVGQIPEDLIRFIAFKIACEASTRYTGPNIVSS